MEGLKIHIRYVMLCCGRLRITKMLQKQLRKYEVFIAKMSLLTSKSKTSFQSFVLLIRHLEMKPDCDIYQTLIKML